MFSAGSILTCKDKFRICFQLLKCLSWVSKSHLSRDVINLNILYKHTTSSGGILTAKQIICGAKLALSSISVFQSWKRPGVYSITASFQ